MRRPSPYYILHITHYLLAYFLTTYYRLHEEAISVSHTTYYMLLTYLLLSSGVFADLVAALSHVLDDDQHAWIDIFAVNQHLVGPLNDVLHTTRTYYILHTTDY